MREESLELINENHQGPLAPPERAHESVTPRTGVVSSDSIALNQL